ncbi:MAG: RagB/SusD family nutrient uptake outer membrane protein [Bacteroidota bacterium]|nr:RagB/SusD family nutrient uptake outer membrane protein [Bacteroidota bacterium]
MNKIILILGTILFTSMMTSCVKDLDIKPKDPNTIMAGNLTKEQYKEALGKIYASFVVGSQTGNADNADISGTDINFGTTTRALWNCQELTTDEAICGWGDAGIADFNTQTWSSQNPFLTALYSRLVLTVTYANDFIKLTNGNTDADMIKYNAEARFLRALAYSYAMDCFANPAFTTEADGVGKYYPKQIQRPALFNYVVTELRNIEDKLGDPGFAYPRADKGACWMLLARLYLNEPVYTADPTTQTGGKTNYDSCSYYCTKVIGSGKYALASNYRQNFSADNDYTKNKEMIFSYAQDGIYTQGYVGSTFIIESCSDGAHIDANTLGLTSNTNWGGNRSKKQFINVLIDTVATYGDAVPKTDIYFSACKDKRIYCRQLDHWDIPSASSSYGYGIGIFKFTNNKADGSKADDWNSAYASTDFPVFRLADAYLMRAEANLRSSKGDLTQAVSDVNTIRQRAFGDNNHNVSQAQLTATTNGIPFKFILDERGREFYYEAQRRTDLIRFGQFTDGSYTWAWKGNVFAGRATDKHLNIFPIPGNEVSANTNIKQNAGY